MSKKVRNIAVAAALVAIVSGFAVAQAGTRVISTPTVIVLTVHEVKASPIAFARSANKWDGVRLKYTVFDSTDTTQVGTGNAQCINQPGKVSLCTGALTISVPEGSGQIVAEGLVPQTSPFEIPVVGGTGDFTNAGGYLHVDAVDQITSTYTLNLQP